ncbi:MAG: DUF72 domain-containing protein, partial [Phycisphaerales bacterium]|nr:DUF72 domain-containing protein [Phycisphaerales bacterium]
MRLIRAGTSGFSDPAEDFATLDLVEIRLGRGSMPSLQDGQHWRRIAPAEFDFIVRVEAGHRETAGLRGVRRVWKGAMEFARAVEAALVIVPTPASFRPTDENIDTLDEFFPWAHRAGMRLGWEPRNRSWPDCTLTQLCREHTVSHVVDPMVRGPVRG